MKLKRRARPEPYIPFISLADIAWQIIIFFLIAAGFSKSDALKLPLPAGAAQAAVETNVPKSTPIMIEAGEQTLTLNKQVISVEGLQPQLTALLGTAKTDEDRVVVLRTADDLTFQRNADILDAIQRAGGSPMITSQSQP